MEEERYTFTVNPARPGSKIKEPFVRERPDGGGKAVFFRGVSKIDQEPGKNKPWIKVNRDCFCINGVWPLLMSEKNQLKMKDLPTDEYMEKYKRMLMNGRTVRVSGHTLPELGNKAMLVTSIEIVVAEEREEINYLTPIGGLGEVEVEF